MRKTGLLKTLASVLAIGSAIGLGGCLNDEDNSKQEKTENSQSPYFPPVEFQFAPYFVNLPEQIIFNNLNKSRFFPVCAIDEDGDRMRYSVSNLPERAEFYLSYPEAQQYCESQDVAYFFWSPDGSWINGSQTGIYYPVFRVEDLDENGIPRINTKDYESNYDEQVVEMIVE